MSEVEVTAEATATAFMARAVTLAEQGLYTTMPNPRVGCVLVDPAGQVIGEGFHERAGQAHAEVVALAQAGDAARGATAYVTLEPCAHQGRTGPCAAALVAAGVARVVYGMEDANPLVAGRGLALLRAAGVAVTGPVLPEACAALNPGFSKRMRSGLPWVRIKMAMSLDGRTAMASGESQWITADAARIDVQHWRARSCAIVTGADSVLADNPQLNVRLPELAFTQRQPWRVLVDSRNRIQPDAAVFRVPGRVIWARGAAAEQAPAPAPGDLADQSVAQVEHWSVPQQGKHLSLTELLRRLGAEGVNELLVETGPGLAGAFLREALVDEMVIYIAPKLMGSTARPLFDWSVEQMGAALALDIRSVTAIGPDLRIVARPQAAGG